MRLRALNFKNDSAWSHSIPKELDSENTMVLLFADSEFRENPGVLEEFAAAFPSSKVMGCSTAGEIFGTEISERSAVAAVLKYEQSLLALASVGIKSASESYSAGEALGKRLMKPGLRSIFILSDGLNVNGSELVRGLNSSLPEDVVITGGLAGDGSRFNHTWVIHQGKIASRIITALGVYGSDVGINHGCKGGWDIFGPERVVTRSEGNVLYELDDKPALSLYKEYLGSRAAELPASALLFPLSLRMNAADPKMRVRTILGIDEKMGSMTFAGDIPNGSLAQLMRANFDRLIMGASESALMANDGLPGPKLAVAISCVGRRLVLGERAEEEIEAGLTALPPGTTQIGFYSYGEISPLTKSASTEFHNQTMTYTTFAEHG